MSVIKRPEQVGGWSRYEVLKHDRAGVSRRDGLLEKEELWERIQTLKHQASSLGSSSSLAMDLQSAEQLYNDMVSAGATALQYLPEAIMGLNLSARELATRLLENHGTSTLNHVMVAEAIDQAKGMIPKTLANLGSQSSTLADLEKIKQALTQAPMGPGPEFEAS